MLTLLNFRRWKSLRRRDEERKRLASSKRQQRQRKLQRSSTRRKCVHCVLAYLVFFGVDASSTGRAVDRVGINKVTASRIKRLQQRWSGGVGEDSERTATG
jgi:hypothetical protein